MKPTMNPKDSPTSITTPLDHLLKRRDVQQVVPLSRITLYRRVRARTFPQPVKLGGRLYWRASDVQAWLASLTAAA